jgi:hypothetical protein
MSELGHDRQKFKESITSPFISPEADIRASMADFAFGPMLSKKEFAGISKKH